MKIWTVNNNILRLFIENFQEYRGTRIWVHILRCLIYYLIAGKFIFLKTHVEHYWLCKIKEIIDNEGKMLNKSWIALQ